jgi:hypothetical protein
LLKAAQRITTRDVPTPERRAGCCTVAVGREHAVEIVASQAGTICQLDRQAIDADRGGA